MVGVDSVGCFVVGVVCVGWVLVGCLGFVLGCGWLMVGKVDSVCWLVGLVGSCVGS